MTDSDLDCFAFGSGQVLIRRPLTLGPGTKTCCSFIATASIARASNGKKIKGKSCFPLPVPIFHFAFLFSLYLIIIPQTSLPPPPITSSPPPPPIPSTWWNICRCLHPFNSYFISFLGKSEFIYRLVKYRDVMFSSKFERYFCLNVLSMSQAYS